MFLIIEKNFSLPKTLCFIFVNYVLMVYIGLKRIEFISNKTLKIKLDNFYRSQHFIKKDIKTYIICGQDIQHVSKIVCFLRVSLRAVLRR